MKAYIFLIANLKFHLQTPCSFGDMAENVKLIGIPINNFLCIYIIASYPGLHTLFCLWRVNKKLPQGKTSQNTFQRSRSISWKCKIHMVKWAHPALSRYEVMAYKRRWRRSAITCIAGGNCERFSVQWVCKVAEFWFVNYFFFCGKNFCCFILIYNLLLCSRIFKGLMLSTWH